jgi:hypothetical protein
MKLEHILTSIVALTLLGLASAFSEVNCGSTGPTRTVPADVYGPKIASTAAKACKEVEKTMLTDTCKECDNGMTGCFWSASWQGDEPFCDVNPLPTNPVVYLANITTTSSKRGAVSCSQCDIDPTGG